MYNLSHKRAQVLMLARAGYHADYIASVIGSTPQSVKTMTSAMRREGYEIPYHTPAAPPLEITPAHFDRLSREAAKRGLTPMRLISRVVATILDDDLIGAILDDEADDVDPARTAA